MNRTFGATLLIIGLSIGPPIFALPFSLAILGFSLSVCLLMSLWIFMTYTGLLTLEVNLWFLPGTNFISMSYKSLGKWVSLLTWILYLLFSYSLISAYLTGGGMLVVASFQHMPHLVFSDWVGALPWLIICAIILYFGARNVDYLNRGLMIGFAICFALIATVSSRHMNVELLTGGNLHWFFVTSPIIIVAYCYHFLIPSIRQYLKSDLAKMRRAIIAGSTVTFAIYVLWILILFSVIPYRGKHSLLTLEHAKYPITTLMWLLSWVTHHPWMALLLRFFGFFAITTSFLGITYSLFEFFADSFKIKKSKQGKLVLLGLVFAPPLLYTILYPSGFIVSLRYAGVFVALLFGILPALMVWSGRYVREFSFGYKNRGGRFALTLIIVVSLLIIYVQIKSHI